MSKGLVSRTVFGKIELRIEPLGQIGQEMSQTGVVRVENHWRVLVGAQED